MPILPGPELAAWCELLAVLGIGTSVAVALAAFISRRMRSAVWERAVWQACTLTLLALVALELTGLGAATVRLCVASWSENRSDREIAEAAFTAIFGRRRWHRDALAADGSGFRTSSRASSHLVAGDRLGRRLARPSGTHGLGPRITGCLLVALQAACAMSAFEVACSRLRIDWAFGERFGR